MVPGTSDAKRLIGLGLGDTVGSVVLDLSFDLRDATAEKGKQPVPSLNGRAQLIDVDIAFRSSGGEVLQFLECRVIGRGQLGVGRVFIAHAKAPCEGWWR